MTQKELHEKAIRLVEGGLVEVDSLVVQAVCLTDGYDPCYECSMDCLCKGDIAKLCDELSWMNGSQYFLKLT